MNKNYFNQLNYVLGNEDNSVEFNILNEYTNHVLAAAGSGTRIIPLLAKSPRFLTCIDISKEQLFLTELRIETLRSLDYSQYLAFWGYPPDSLSIEKRKQLFFKLNLSESARTYLNTFFEQINWGSILYEGKWERTFTKISKLLRFFVGKAGVRLFDFTKVLDHSNYLKNDFPRRRWNLAIFFLGNSVVFNTLLYRGNFPKKNIAQSYYEFYKNAFEGIFKLGPARNNFFLQLLFLGRIVFPEGLPFDCDREIYHKAKQGLRSTEVKYLCGDIVDTTKNITIPIDFLSFSDIPSYFKGLREETFLEDLSKNLAPNALVVLRHYLRIPNADLRSFLDITLDHRQLIEKEKMQVYTIQVLKKKI